MNDFLLWLVWMLGGFVWGAMYGRMKGQRSEDELLVKIADLNERVRILKKRLDAE